MQKCEEIVLVNDLLGKFGDGNKHILVFHHWHPQVNVLEVHCCTVGYGVGYCGFDVEFDVDCIVYGSSEGAVADNTIANNGPADDIFCFLG